MTDGIPDAKPARVPARAHQRWNPPSAYDLTDTESLADILGDEAKSRSLSIEHPLTGKPDAGDPPVRFGGRGGVMRHPYPYPARVWNVFSDQHGRVLGAIALYVVKQLTASLLALAVGTIVPVPTKRGEDQSSGFRTSILLPAFGFRISEFKSHCPCVISDWN